MTAVLADKPDAFIKVRNRNVSSLDADNPTYGMQIKTSTNWADGHVPEKMRGVFYMEGNPYPAELFSTASSFWNATTLSTDVPTYRPRTWSSDTDQLTSNLKQGTIFQTRCNLNALGLIHCDIQQYAKRDNKLVHPFGDYTLDEVAGQTDRFLRLSNVPGVPLARYPYTMWRIVDENGKRTDKWYSVYEKNIGRTTLSDDGQVFVHLGKYQLVPQKA